MDKVETIASKLETVPEDIKVIKKAILGGK